MIITIDPSIAKPGWAVLRVPDGLLVSPRSIAALYVDSGQWGTDARHDIASRLAYLAEECGRLCDRYPPTRAFVEEPAYHGVYRSRQAGKSAEMREAILGKSVAGLHRAIGVFLSVLGQRCPTETVKATNPLGRAARGVKRPRDAAKQARRALVVSYWPHLAEAPEDEIDAVHLGLVKATDRRMRWKEAA